MYSLVTQQFAEVLLASVYNTDGKCLDVFSVGPMAVGDVYYASNPQTRLGLTFANIGAVVMLDKALSQPGVVQIIRPASDKPFERKQAQCQTGWKIVSPFVVVEGAGERQISRKIAPEQRLLLEPIACSMANNDLGVTLRTACALLTASPDALGWLQQHMAALLQVASQLSAAVQGYTQSRQPPKAGLVFALAPALLAPIAAAQTYLRQVKLHPNYTTPVATDALPTQQHTQSLLELAAQWSATVFTLPSAARVIIEPTHALLSVDVNSANTNSDPATVNAEAITQIAAYCYYNGVHGLVVMDLLKCAAPKATTWPVLLQKAFAQWGIPVNAELTSLGLLAFALPCPSHKQLSMAALHQLLTKHA